MREKINTENMSDEEFAEFIKPLEESTRSYLKDIIQDYVAFYIAKSYELNCLSDCPLDYHINAALNEFTMPNISKDFSYKRLQSTLKNKYNLEIINKETSLLTEVE